MNTTVQKTVGEIVAEDYRTAAIFENFGIDFCCRGNRTVEQACAGKQVGPEAVYEALGQLKSNEAGRQTDYASWPSDLLADYIEKKHHRYVEESIPVLNQFLDKLCQVHGSRHPELFEIAREFRDSSGALAMHMKKEELVLFPYVRKMIAYLKSGQPFPPAHFGQVSNPLQTLMREHDDEGERFRKISELSNSYTVPDDGCTTYRVAFQMLNDFEKDLHLHIHLENNILFPAALKMEQQLKS